MTEKSYYLTTAKYDNQLYFYLEITDKNLTEFFSLENNKTYFERTKRNTLEDVNNLINRHISKYSNKNKQIKHKIANKREFKQFLKNYFPYELKFYNFTGDIND